MISDSACVPMTESSFDDDASDDDAVEVEADCEWVGLWTLSKFCPPLGAEIVRDSCRR